MGLSKTLLRSGMLAAAFVTVAAISQPASAAQITCNFIEGNPAQTTTYTLNPSSDAVCGGDQTGSGNLPFDDEEVTLTFDGMPAMTYFLAFKIDDEGVGDEGDGAITFLDAPTIGAQSGDWTISGLGEQTVIALKAGNNWAAFLVDDFSGDWATDRGLSSASIWYKGDITPIPLPASLPLFLAGLAGIGLLTRRRRAA